MTKPVRLDPAAQEELAEAEAWYEEQAGLGGDLVAAVREAGDRIAERPSRALLAGQIIERGLYAFLFVGREHLALLRRWRRDAPNHSGRRGER